LTCDFSAIFGKTFFGNSKSQRESGDSPLSRFNLCYLFQENQLAEPTRQREDREELQVKQVRFAKE
jgi:hypothetical protein